MRANPQGRVDLLALGIAERAVKTRVEPCLGTPVWDGLKPILADAVKAGMKRLGIPRKDVFAHTPIGKAVKQALQARGGVCV